MGYEKFLGIAINIFTGFSCERFLGISADSQERFLGICTDFPQNCYLGRLEEYREKVGGIQGKGWRDIGKRLKGIEGKGWSDIGKRLEGYREKVGGI